MIPGFKILLGMFILILSYILWKATGNFVGWLILFAPGAGYIFRGFYEAFHDKDGF